VAPFSEQVMTFTVVVDPYFQGHHQHGSDQPPRSAVTGSRPGGGLYHRSAGAQDCQGRFAGPVVQGSELEYAVQ